MKRALIIVTLALLGGRVARAQTETRAKAQTNAVGKPAPDDDNKNAHGKSAPPAELDASKLTKVPKQKTFVEAEYPADAFAKGIETDVTLLIDINADGGVDGVSVLEPSKETGFGFDDAATAAAAQFTFEPAEIDGKPIAIQVPYKYKFRIKTKAAPEAPVTAPARTAASPGTPPPAPPKPAPVVNYSGRLLERGTRTPMLGVLVTIFQDTETGPVGFEATTDKIGHFQFYNLANGAWKVSIEAPGYYPYRTTEDVHPGEGTVVTYFVERGTYNPFDVTTTAERPRKEVNRVVLPASVIEKIPGAAGDPLKVVENLPGVARAPLFTGQIIVRGSAPEDTQIFVDGATIPIVYHFGGLRSVIPVGMLDNIEFQPGNFSTYYGRATGGIIDIQIKQLKPKRPGGYVDVSLLDTGLYLETPIGDKAAVAIAARRSYIDAILNATVPSDANVNLVAAPVYYDYQILANYRPAPAHDLRAFFFGSDDNLALLFRNPGEASNEITGNRLESHTAFYRGLIEYRYVPSERFENMLRVSVGKDTTDLSLGNLVFNWKTGTTQVRDNARWKLSQHLTLVTGVDLLLLQPEGLFRLPLPPKEGEPQSRSNMAPDFSQLIESSISNTQWWSPAAYTELELKPVERWLIVGGVRADYFSRVSQGTVAPRLTTRYQLVPSVTLKGGVGLFYQEPFFDETDKKFGNPNLKTERAVHYSVGAEWKPRPFITVDGTLFYKDLSSLASPTDKLVTIDGVATPLRYDNNGAGRVYGFEFLAKHDFTDKLAGWVAYTLSRSERRDSGATSYRLFDYDQTHILTAILSYQLPRNWLVGGRFRLVSGDPLTPVIGSIVNSNADRNDPTYGAINSARAGAFHQLDLRIDKKWIYDGWMLTAYLDIQNVYNRSNPEGGLSYNYDYSQSKPTQGLPLFPILGMKAEF